MMKTSTIAWGAVLGATGVAAGAFGAHALSGTISPERLDVFETAVRYQMYHALALLLCAALTRPEADLRWPARCFLAGALVFSGSLYLLVLLDTSWLGAVTPIGGTLFVAGWILLALRARSLASAHAREQ